jgi:hypothetical protein
LLRKWVLAVGMGSPRPLRAVSGVGISDFLREKSMSSTLAWQRMSLI